MKSKKILGILPSYSPGGAEKVMLMYLNALEKRNLYLKLFVSNSKGPLRNKNINSIEHKYRRFLYAIPSLLRSIKANNIEILLSTFPHTSIILIIAKILKFHNCSIVVRQPNMILPSLNTSLKLRIMRFLYLKVINLADIIIITSKAMSKEAQELGLIKNKLFLLSNPIDELKIRRNITPTRTKRKQLKIVFVGRLSYQKGIDRVIQVFSYLDDIEFIVIGEGPEKKRLDKMCLQYNLDKKIKFYGFIKNPYSIIAGADYFLLPSRWEGMPNCVIESLALGTPVIAFKEITSLKDFERNIMNQTIILTENTNSLLKLLKKLKPRKDYLKPRLRKSLLFNSLTEKSYRKKLDEKILSL